MGDGDMKARVISGTKELEDLLSALGSRADGVAKKAVYDGIAVVKKQVDANLRAAVSGKGTGDLVKSLGVSKITENGKGGYDAKIGFDGKDRRGVPNQLKARVLEAGSSQGRKGKGFIRKAVASSKEAAVAAAKARVETELKKLQGGN
jgi:hypothetical protein